MTVNNFEFQFQMEWPYHHTMLKLLFFTQCTWPDCLLPYSSSIQGFTLSFSTSVLVIFYLLSNVSFPFFISKRIILPSFWHKYIFLFLLGQIENFINLHNLRFLNFLLTASHEMSTWYLIFISITFDHTLHCIQT